MVVIKMKCKECGSELVRCRTSGNIRYYCPNDDCPVMYARNRGRGHLECWEWVYESTPREKL